jgi:hypothetical protein
MAQQDLDQIRAIAQRLVERIREDPAFKDLVRANPQVLLDEGLPEVAVADLLRSTDLLDVAGYLGCSSISSL